MRGLLRIWHCLYYTILDYHTPQYYAYAYVAVVVVVVLVAMEPAKAKAGKVYMLMWKLVQQECYTTLHYITTLEYVCVFMCVYVRATTALQFCTQTRMFL